MATAATAVDAIEEEYIKSWHYLGEIIEIMIIIKQKHIRGHSVDVDGIIKHMKENFDSKLCDRILEKLSNFHSQNRNLKKTLEKLRSMDPAQKLRHDTLDEDIDLSNRVTNILYMLIDKLPIDTDKIMAFIKTEENKKKYGDKLLDLLNKIRVPKADISVSKKVAELL